LEDKKDKLREDNEVQYQQYLKVKDEPIRLTKNIQTIKQGVTVLKQEVKKAVTDIESYE
jgi:hypothetical protein